MPDSKIVPTDNMPQVWLKVNTMKKNFARLLIGSGENSPEIRYLTGISTPDDFICLEYSGSVTALMSKLEISRAKEYAKPGVSVLLETDYGSTRLEIISRISEVLKVNAFEVPPDFPLGIADKLRTAGLEITVSEAAFCPGRICKTPDEVRFITASQRAGEAGFARAVEVLKESAVGNDGGLLWQNTPLTSETLRAEIDCTILKHGALPTGTICAGAIQSAQPHNAGSGRLFAGTPIVMDIFPRNPETGYWGDLTRTVVKGKAPETVKKAYAAVKAARDTVKKNITVGADCAKLHLLAEKVLDRHRFYTGISDGEPFGFFHGLGHGVGLEIHEVPRLSPRSCEKLKGGEVFTVEPGVYYREWGGIRLEDLIYLAPDGTVNNLTSAPDFLEID